MDSNFLKNNSTELLILIFSFMAAFVSYGYLCNNLALAGDDWTAIISGSYLSKFMVSIGRWNHYFLSNLFGNRVFAPTFTFFTLVLAISISAIVTSTIVKFQYYYSKLIFSILFVSYPIWYEGYLFNMGRLPKSLGVLCSIIGAAVLIQFLRREDKSYAFGWKAILLSVFLITISIGCYQTYVFFGVFLLAIYLMEALNKLEINKFLFDLKTILLVLVCSGILYVLLTKIIALVVGVEIQSSGRYGISNVFSSGNLLSNFSTTISHIFSYYTQSGILIPFWIKLTGLGAFLYYCYTNLVLKTNLDAKIIRLVLKILICLFLLCLPWALGFIKGDEVFRYNSLTVLSLSYAFFFIFTFEALYTKEKFRKPVLIISSIIIVWILFINSAASFSKFISNKRDFALSEKLLGYIHESPNYSGNPIKKYTISFVGKNPYKANQQRPFDLEKEFDFKVDNLINKGVWDGQIGRIKHIFMLLGEPGKRFHFNSYSSKDSRKVDAEFLRKNMIGDFNGIKNWPHKNSVISLKNGKSFIVIFDKSGLKKNK